MRDARLRRARQVKRASSPGGCRGAARTCSTDWAGPCCGATPRRAWPRRAGRVLARIVTGLCSRVPTVARTSSMSHFDWLCVGGWTRSSATYLKRVAGIRRGARRVVHARPRARRRQDERPCAAIFADASGAPARLGAVLCIDGEILYTSRFVTDEEKAWFSARGDQQIAGLELLAIALAFSTWEGARRRVPSSARARGVRSYTGLLRDRAIAVWSDNVVAEGSLRKGSAKAWDHTCIVHALWLRAAVLRAALWIYRVDTKCNPADAPSRGDFALLRRLAATWSEPVLAPEFRCASAWAALRLPKLF